MPLPDISLETVTTIIDSLPDDLSRELRYLLDETLATREKIKDQPVWVRGFFANLLGHNVVAALKRYNATTPAARQLIHKVMDWAFDMPDTWKPKWAVLPTVA